ncbi:GIY-YIG nuclease family protein [Candidatus Daviesbacteria bacterium]|nr:GIY-YIG nuclease family protein [Candidatus Daviesbacteria bacterium]
MFYVYILLSTKDHKYYYGSTNNIERRFFEHNCGKVDSTKNRRPLKLHYVETFNERKDALKREFFFKKRSGYKWLKMKEII